MLTPLLVVDPPAEVGCRRVGHAGLLEGLPIVASPVADGAVASILLAGLAMRPGLRPLSGGGVHPLISICPSRFGFQVLCRSRMHVRCVHYILIHFGATDDPAAPISGHSTLPVTVTGAPW